MISVIIPTLNEEKALPSLLRALVQEDTDKEIIVVDGGSHDNTIRLAQDYGAKVLISLPGRGAAINRGASEARGDLSPFLHADTLFPAGGLKKIKETLADQPKLVGAIFVYYSTEIPFQSMAHQLLRLYPLVRTLLR